MAKLKFGMIVTEGRGKLGGHVLSKNRYGAYARTKVTPVNPQSPAQQAARNILSAFSQAWSGLTQEAILAWNNAVGDFSRTDVFGDLRNPTGKNLFTRLNINLNSIGVIPIDAPPLPSEVPSAAIVTVEINPTLLLYSIVFTGDSPLVSYQIWATPALSPGISFVSSEYRLIDSVAGGAGSPIDFNAAYVNRFGVPAVGAKVFVKMVPIHLVTGQNAVGSSASTIVL